MNPYNGVVRIPRVMVWGEMLIRYNYLWKGASEQVSSLYVFSPLEILISYYG